MVIYLLAHNAHLTAIQTPPVPADPGLNVTGSGPVDRWAGDAQAYVDEDTTDEVRGNQRIRISDAIVELPVNIPVWPNEEDWIQLRYLNGTTEKLIVRRIDRGLWPYGRLRVVCRRS